MLNNKLLQKVADDLNESNEYTPGRAFLVGGGTALGATRGFFTGDWLAKIISNKVGEKLTARAAGGDMSVLLDKDLSAKINEKALKQAYRQFQPQTLSPFKFEVDPNTLKSLEALKGRASKLQESAKLAEDLGASNLGKLKDAANAAETAKSAAYKAVLKDRQAAKAAQEQLFNQAVEKNRIKLTQDVFNKRTKPILKHRGRVFGRIFGSTMGALSSAALLHAITSPRVRRALSGASDK